MGPARARSDALSRGSEGILGLRVARVQAQDCCYRAGAQRPRVAAPLGVTVVADDEETAHAPEMQRLLRQRRWGCWSALAYAAWHLLSYVLCRSRHIVRAPALPNVAYQTPMPAMYTSPGAPFLPVGAHHCRPVPLEWCKGCGSGASATGLKMARK